VIKYVIVNSAVGYKIAKIYPQIPRTNRFQHEATDVHLAVHLMVTADQADALGLQVFDERHSVAVGQHIAIGILGHRVCFVISVHGFYLRPFIAAVSADMVVAAG
jgi:hypothetical protein